MVFGNEFTKIKANNKIFGDIFIPLYFSVSVRKWHAPS